MDKEYFFDRKRNIKLVVAMLFICCTALVVVGFIAPVEHPHFEWERYPQFYAVYGFVAFVVLVLAAKWFLRPLVKRDEDYYDR